MAYKRHIDRLPIIPADATKHNVTCHYCIVGCGYHAYTWPINKQGGTAASDNAFGVDLSRAAAGGHGRLVCPVDVQHRQAARAGRAHRHHAGPRLRGEFGPGLSSRRAHGRAELLDGAGSQQQRLTDPMVWRYGQMQPTSWDDALDLVARVTAAVIKDQGEDGLFVSSSTTAARPAATRTPGAPASSTSNR